MHRLLLRFLTSAYSVGYLMRFSLRIKEKPNISRVLSLVFQTGVHIFVMNKAKKM
ncbi:Uncharacterized protein FORC55_3180 [Vibrio cholerae]|nr:Uncharacterized protein FORC55_3180 [Vibrio cholerae]